MSADARRVTKTEVWVGWENQVVNSAYPLRRFLGGSNHSAVFLTEYRPEGVANAAIKLIPADTLETEAQLVQWGTAATLNHPHLLRLFDVGRCHIGGRPFLYIVMEYADQTLAELLPRRALTPDETRDMLIPALSALNFLHRNNLVQGQVKPANLLVIGDQIKLATDTIRSVGKLPTGILRASLHDPPELKDGEIAPAGDIWGLGVTLVEALTQHPPSWPDSKSETVSLTASIPPLFVDTVRRCLNRTPANRPTAAELQGQFDPAVHAHPITVVVAEEPVYEVSTVSTAADEVAAKPARMGESGGMLVLSVAAVVVLGLAVWVSRTIFVSQVESSPATAAVTPRAIGSQPIAGAGNAQPAVGASAVQSAAAQAAAASGADQQTVGANSAQLAASAVDSQGNDSGASISTRDAGTGGAVASIGTDSSVGSADTTRAYATGAVGSGDGLPRYGSTDVTAAHSVAPDLAAADATPTTARPMRKTSAPGANPTAAVTGAAIGATTVPADADLSSPQPEILGSVLHQKLPDIPRNIRERIRGHVNVTVRVLVDPSGNVVGEFLESAGPSRYFAHQAGDAAMDWKFVSSDGRGPRVWMLKFEFTRAGATVRAVSTQ